MAIERYFSMYTGAQIDEKLTPAYGGIHNHNNAVAQSIPNGSTYTKLINFSGNNEQKNVTSDYTNNKITITKTGTYKVEGSFSQSAGTANVVWWVTAFLDGVEQDSIHWNRKITIAGDVGSASLNGSVKITSVPVDIDVRVRHDSGGAVNLTLKYANFNVNRIDI